MLKSRLRDQDSQLTEVRAQRDRLDEENRGSQSRYLNEYSSTQSKMNDLENNYRRKTMEYDEIKIKYEYVGREYENCKQDLKIEKERNYELKRELLETHD